ncbi:phosphotransferase family protein [Streptomyces sp. 12297]
MVSGSGAGRRARWQRLLHLDLHPENVILTDRGPRVIDWTTARVGRPEVDVAMTFVILRGIVLRPHERLLIRGFLRAVARSCGTDPRTGMPVATERRLGDPHLTETEAGLVRGPQRRYA